jgi:pimeloyl-ACP methyl ester carboxylesterase
MSSIGSSTLHEPRDAYIEASDHADIFTRHGFPEQTIDLGEIRMNFATAGSPTCPALVLIPAQTMSWWSYKPVMHLLSASYHVFAVDLRGQGRSTWTPGRYSLDNMGSDMVRFIDRAVGRPAIACGMSSGGVIAAWLAAFALPGQIRAVVLEDAPLFSSEVRPPVGQGQSQTVPGLMFRLWARHLGPQWAVADTDGLKAALKKDMPPWTDRAFKKWIGGDGSLDTREYDPEWAEAFWTGSVGATCDHENMLRHVKVPILFTHHFREIDVESGGLRGAMSDVQVGYAKRLVEAAGHEFAVKSFPEMPHSMHGFDPATYVATVTGWLSGLGLGEALTPPKDGPL